MTKGMQVFNKAFSGGRELRSDAYKAGALYVLQRRLDGATAAKCPFATGTAEAIKFLRDICTD